MADRIEPDDWEDYYLCDNCVGLADVHESHAQRVAAILSEKNPGLLILWGAPGKDGRCAICAVRPDKRAIPASREEKLVAAAERIARNVANKHPIRWGLFGIFRKRIRAGWHYTEPTKRSKKRGRKAKGR
jgi:hypothetical protein